MVIEVVLPTYNGEAHLLAQVESINLQSHRPRRLFIRDDCSTDSTPKIIKYIAHLYGPWLHVLPSTEHIGCLESINILLAATSARYVALSDQDDIWKLDKLEISLTEMIHTERVNGSLTPCLIHSDLSLITKSGRSLLTTASKQNRISLKRNSYMDICLTNVVTGCTALVNRPLLDISIPIPNQVPVHDWWLALVASKYGVIRCLPEPTVLYRQHDNNQIGAKGIGLRYCAKRLSRIISREPGHEPYLAALRQVLIFENHFTLHNSITLNHLSDSSNYINRFLEVLRLLLERKLPTKHGVLRTLVFYSFYIFK